MWETAGATDARDHYSLVSGQLQGSEATKGCIEDTKIATARAPRRFDFAFIIFERRVNKSLYHS
jgi:hypothetical protein